MLKSCAILLLLYVLSCCLSYRLPVISRYFNQQRRILSSSTSSQSTSLKSIESNAYNEDSSIETFQSQEEYLEFLQTQCKLPKGKKYSTNDVTSSLSSSSSSSSMLSPFLHMNQCGSVVGHPDHY